MRKALTAFKANAIESKAEKSSVRRADAFFAKVEAMIGQTLNG
jgi:hypothetical protein